MKLLAPFVALVGALAIFVQFDRDGPRADLVLVNSNEVFTLDPQRMTWLQDFRLAYALYEGLARWNNETFSVEPAVAALALAWNSTLASVAPPKAVSAT